MAEWLVEDGIGETRALLVENDTVVAASLHWPGEMRAGDVVEAKLVSKASGSVRGSAETANGQEILVDKLPAGVSEGKSITVRVTRAALAERGRFKRAQGRIVDLDETVGSKLPQGRIVRRFPAGLWDEVWHAASSGQIEFAGGTLVFSTTPAMTVIDVDGDLPPRELALAAIPALAQGLRWFDLGGSIGIDFPTLSAKADRKAVDAAMEEALADWPHEHTAMNGFGFVQIVSRLEGPSLLHRFHSSRVGASARMALRRAEILEGAGATLLTVHPALKAKLKPDWLEELARRTGRELRIEADPGLALESSNAQIVAR